MSDQATDEEVAKFKCYLNILGASTGGAVVHKLLDLSAKLLARLERVERELERVRAELHGEW